MGRIGILYEHPEWFRPLFAEMERRGLLYERLEVGATSFNPAERPRPYALVVNRMSPSAYLRGHGGAIAYTRELLAYLDEHEVPLVNGPQAFALECSKMRQALLLERLGLAYPRTRVVTHPTQLQAAASELEYPLMVKPNLGGSGALMRRFEQAAELEAAVADGEIELGPDGVGLLQEYHPAREQAIVRVEALDGRYLYAIRVPVDPTQGFNLCPADLCGPNPPAPFPFGRLRAGSGREGGEGRQVEAFEPSEEVVRAVLAIMAAGRLDVCGVEYLESERDGQLYFYDINALSNFVVDAPRVVGFDPFLQLVDYLERRSQPDAANERRRPLATAYR